MCSERRVQARVEARPSRMQDRSARSDWLDAAAQAEARELQVLFCGITRATVRPEILCRGANPVVAERIHGGLWPVRGTTRNTRRSGHPKSELSDKGLKSGQAQLQGYDALPQIRIFPSRGSGAAVVPPYPDIIRRRNLVDETRLIRLLRLPRSAVIAEWHLVERSHDRALVLEAECRASACEAQLASGVAQVSLNR